MIAYQKLTKKEREFYAVKIIGLTRKVNPRQSNIHGIQQGCFWRTGKIIKGWKNSFHG